MESSRSGEVSAGSLSLGFLFLLTGAAVMLLARQIPSATLGETHDPGPRAFPVGLGFLLFLGGFWECFLVWRHGRTASMDMDCGGPRRRIAVYLVLGLIAYAAVMPWLGFIISTLLFATLVMGYLGIRWSTATAASVLLVVSIQLLFVRLFKVPLPGGLLDFL
jgi:putative tricarboxylic transport membrane protein